MTYITVLAFDPGLITGFCEVGFNSETRHGAFETRNLSSLAEVWQRLKAPEGKNFQVHVISEGFHLYPHRAAAKIGSSFPEIERIGVIRLACELHQWPHYERPASMVKNAKIPPQFSLRGRTPHEKDAFLHALLCLRTILKVKIDDLNLLAV